MQDQKINAVQNFDNNPILSDHQTISHAPDKFLIDFKGINPQFTPDNQPTMIINHKLVLLEPYIAKEFLKILQENIQKFEEKYGEIKIPESIKTAQKEVIPSKENITTSEKPSYMG